MPGHALGDHISARDLAAGRCLSRCQRPFSCRPGFRGRREDPGSGASLRSVAERVGVSLPKQTKDLAWLTPEKSPIDTHRALPRVANLETAHPENRSDF